MQMDNQYFVEKILSKKHHLVYLASDGTNKFIIKKFKISEFKNSNESAIINEFQADPNFVNLISSFQNEQENSISLVFEYIPHSFRTQTTIQAVTLKQYFYQLILAVSKLHDIGYAHCNITLEHCLLLDDNLKISDFTYTRKIGEIQRRPITSYSSPEQILGNHQISTEQDIWAIACVISEVIRGKPIFPGKDSSEIFISIIKLLGTPSIEEMKQMNAIKQQQLQIEIRKQPLVQLFDFKINYYLIDLLSKMFIYNPKERISLKEALQHPYFK